MPEVKYVVQADQTILLMDFAHIAEYGILPGLVDEAIRLAHSSNTHHSVLALIDLSGTRITKPVIESLKNLSKNNGPFMKAVAFAGLNLSWSVLVSIVLRVSGRQNHKVFNTSDQALRWLVSQVGLAYR